MIAPAPNSAAPFAFTEPPKVLLNRRGEPIPLRRLTPAERARYRRRINLAFALMGLVVLAIVLVVLVRVRP